MLLTAWNIIEINSESRNASPVTGKHFCALIAILFQNPASS